MNRSIEQAFNGLLPTLNGDIPTELVELAITLLAQSRSRTSNLKPEEEIARSYACANLACERLKLKLGLPKLQDRPPCPPRVYHKLYRYLDKQLSHLESPRRRFASASKSENSSPAPRTTSKISRSRDVTPLRRTTHERGPTQFLPLWTSALIRYVCSNLSKTLAIPHVIAGVTSTVEMSSNLSKDEVPQRAISENEIPPLVVAIVYLVTRHMSNDDSAGGLEALSRLIEISSQFRSPDYEIHGITLEKVDGYLKYLKDIEWQDSDWWKNIRNNLDSEEELKGIETEHPSQNGDTVPENSTRMYGLGTMMQPKVDYISAERRKDFVGWKRVILQRIETIEQGQVQS